MAGSCDQSTGRLDCVYVCLIWDGCRGVCRRSKKLAFKDDKAPFVLEIDDETDEDILAALQQKEPPPGTYPTQMDVDTK